MGIPSLLPSLENAMEEVDLTYFYKQVAGVDVSCWIYGALKRGESKVFTSVLYKIRLLYEAGVIPILVFDGTRPGAKQATALIRKKNRDKYLDRKKIRHPAGNGNDTDINIKSIEEKLLNVCKRRGLCWVQAPFEADIQLVYLIRIKIIQFVITEDSDLIVHGVRKILFKWRGRKGKLYDAIKFEKCWGAPYDEEAFRALCILIKCDYLPGGLRDFGISHAKTIYPQLSIPFDLNQLKQLVGKFKPDPSFWKQFEDAADTFKYQPIYDLTSRTTMPVNPYPEGKSSADYPFAGVNTNALVDHHIDFTFDPLPFLTTCDNEDNQQTKQAVVILRHCSKCKAAFRTKQELAKHYLCNHSLECHICKGSFRDQKQLDLHMKLHGDSKEYKCDLCHKEFKLRDSLVQHIRKIHNQPKRTKTDKSKFKITTEL